MSDAPRKPRSPKPAGARSSGKPGPGQSKGGGGFKKGGKSGGGYRGKPKGDFKGRSKGGSGNGYKGRPDGAAPRRDRVPLTNAQRARKAAAMAVGDVLGRGYRLEGSLAKNPALDGLDARDRAFARAIAATTLRRLGQIDAVLAPLVKRPPPGRVQAYLQTAAAQMIFMDVAPHAAVGDTVGLVKADGKGEPFSGLVNAVLRKVADTGKSDAAKVPPVNNIPGWMRSEWSRLYGKATVRRMAVLLANAPPLDLSVASDPEGWAERLGGTVLAGETVRLDAIGNVAALDGYEGGQWWAQDVAAALPARILARAAGGLAGKRVADLCAAPGGKTMQMAAMGAHVTALDLSEARTGRLRQNLDRTGLQADVVTTDLADYAPEETFAAVLLDAPCSATGTFRRRPDVLYNRRERDITPLTRLQDKLLAHAAKCVSPGGMLLYSVCSLQQREGADRVRKFLKTAPEFRLVVQQDAPGLDLPAERFEDGMVRLLPPDAPDGRGMDGFFIAVLQRAD
ncbi:MAG: RsmB/NOP family class I SAM-dependent RNA methyltransferase [Pseudomonadota bacterium]